MTKQNKNKNKMKLLGILLLIIVIGIIFISINYNKNNSTNNIVTNNQKEVLKVGVNAPFTGSSALFGKSLKEGIELYLSDLDTDNLEIEVIYEDNKGDPKESVNAYNRLTSVDNVDVVISIMSYLSTPLSDLAESKKVPLIVTLVSAEDITKNKNYVFRLFQRAQNICDDTFLEISKKDYSKIGILSRSDDYGISFLNCIKEKLENIGVEVIDERFAPTQTDFKTSLIKFKSEDIDAMIFSGVIPIEINNVLEQKNIIIPDITFYEASNQLTIDSIREDSLEYIGEAYTLKHIFPQEIKEKYIAKYGKNPQWTVSYAYDSMDLIYLGYKNNKEDIAQGIRDLKTFNGVEINGGEINYEVEIIEVK